MFSENVRFTVRNGRMEELLYDALIQAARSLGLPLLAEATEEYMKSILGNIHDPVNIKDLQSRSPLEEHFCVQLFSDMENNAELSSEIWQWYEWLQSIGVYNGRYERLVEMLACMISRGRSERTKLMLRADNENPEVDLISD